MNENFSLSGFEKLLYLLLFEYGCKFVPFEKLTLEKRNIFLRHDIDFDLNDALIMANLEKKHGISAMYFISYDSPFYNIFSKDNVAIVKNIIDMGHKVGLHIDERSNFNEKEILHIIDFMSHKIGKIDSKLISRHRPVDLYNYHKFEQLTDVYEVIIDGKVKYISDSKRTWRFDDFYFDKPLQLLLHPLWWCNSQTSLNDVIKVWANKRKSNTYCILKKFFEIGKML